MNILITKSEILQGTKPSNTEGMDKPVSFSKCRPGLYFEWKWRSLFHPDSIYRDISVKRGLYQVCLGSHSGGSFKEAFYMTFLILHLPRKFDFGLKKKKKKTLNHRLLNFWKVSITSYDVWVIFQCKQRGCWRKSLGFQIMVRTGEWEGPAKNGQQMGRRQVMLTWKRCLMDCMDSLFTYHAGLGQCWKHFKEKKKNL